MWPVSGAPICRWLATSHSRTVLVVAAGGQGLAVRAERHRVDGVGVAGERGADLPVAGHVPQPHRAVAAAAGQGLAVRAERHRVDGIGVTRQDGDARE